jgi:hypothetical protein
VDEWHSSERPPDPREEEARQGLLEFFELNRQNVFFSRQLEVRFEDQWYHWITNRALRHLVERGIVRSEVRGLKSGGEVHAVWHRSHRYPRRDITAIVRLVEEYADPNIGAALGLTGEWMILEGFAKHQFVMRGRNTREHAGKRWTASQHDLDFVFERDGIAYGVEVKNTLGYMDYEELATKRELCSHLGIKPVFAVRMLPRSWIKEIIDSGGYALILKYQLYPLSHRELARRVGKALALPIDAPKALADGTMGRFVTWHSQNR